MSQHAPLAPSSASRRKACAGSRKMEALYPQPDDSPHALEGTAAHWAASEMLSGRTVDSGQIAENGVMLTDEMIEAATMYVDEIRKVLIEHPDCILHVEERVGIEYINDDCWGTPDCWLYDGIALHLWDFKYGHRFVDVFENWQLIEYAAGILDYLGIDGLRDEYIYVVMTIVQPRCYVGGSPVRSWRVRAVDLRGYFNAARMFEAKAMDDNASLTVSPECRDCSARHACPALQRAAYADMNITTEAVPFDLPPEALGTELRYIQSAINTLTARATSLEEQALSMIRHGASIPHYIAQHGMGRERWIKPEAEVIAMGALMGVDLGVTKLVTPKQAIKAGMPEAVVKSFTEIPRGELKLVPEDGSKARKIFGSVTK